MRRPTAHAAAVLLLGLGIGLPPGVGLSPGTGWAAGGNRAPDAPTRLTVDARSAPVAVDGVPQFGWLPQDRDDGEVQTAYQIRVVRAADGVTVFDSRRTASGSQSWVRYAGPPLTPGTAYTWTVRTFDRAGAASPYATPASFGTGLGDGDWSGARWIRRPATGTDAADEWTLARAVLAVPAGSPVVRARAYLSAPGDWALHVDGAVVQRGSSYGYPGEGYYDAVELPGVRAGRPLAVGVRYHYWQCRCQGRANGPTSGEGPSGLLAKVVVEHADGTRDVLVTDAGWRVARDGAHPVAPIMYRNSDAGDPVEHYDATGDPAGWDTAGGSDTGWAAATVIGAHPRPDPPSCAGSPAGSRPCAFTHLSAVEPHVTRTPVHPVSVQRLADGTVVADLGRVYAAVPRVSFRAGTAGRVVTVTTGYRRTNTTLSAAIAAGASEAVLVTAGGIRVGDRVTLDAPAVGFGAGDPETRTVVSVGPATPGGTAVRLDAPVDRPHATGDWVEGSRVGTSGLDTQGSDMRFQVTQRAGAQTATAFTYWGWRFLQVSGAGEDLDVGQLAAVVQATDAPAGEASTFHSDNPTLDAVFDLMRHSALQSAQNVFLDTPTREKGQFLGDTIDQSFATMEALHERNLTRQAIVEFAASQDRYWPNGAMNAVYPNGDGQRDIPDYTQMFPEWVMRYHELTGDTVLVTRVLPAMRRVADYVLAAVDARGLVYQLPGGSGPYQYGIIDWPPAMRYDTVVAGNGARTVVNALGVGALRAVAAAAALTGDTAGAQTYGRRAADLTAAMNDQLRDPATGRYSDGLAVADGTRIESFSQHSQSYPVVYGVAPTDAYPALGPYIASAGMRQGPMDLRQLLAALRLTDHPDAVVRLLTDPTGDGPARILAEDGTFMWEQWTPGCTTAGCRRDQVNQASSDSMSHGWGAAGISEMLRTLLGVTPTSPGAATVRIAPPSIEPGTADLSAARGTTWTERGPVSVAWTRTADGYAVDVTVPVNVTATVVLPAPPDGARYRARGTGRRSADGSGTTYTVGSGTTRITPCRCTT